MLPQTPSRYGMQDRLTNLSIGMGRGLTDQLEGTKQLVTQPVATAQALIEAARQMGTDPRIVLDMLRAARQKAMSGALGLGELIGGNVPMGVRGAPVMREIDVYHGSPHRFEEFDASKIGTGEGAQVYGRGLYFAENPDVAKQYKKASDLTPEELEKQLKYALYKAETSNDPLVRDAFKNAAAQLKQSGGKQGSLYTADLPDEMVDQMVDWDKPLKDQPKILDAVFKSGLRHSLYRVHGYKKLEDFTGGDLVNIVGNQPTGIKRLQELGIPGVKYLDAGSRSGEGTRNFVVFPGEEKKVKILKRE
jgi:hypothetical protein